MSTSSMGLALSSAMTSVCFSGARGAEKRMYTTGCRAKPLRLPARATKSRMCRSSGMSSKPKKPVKSGVPSALRRVSLGKGASFQVLAVVRSPSNESSAWVPLGASSPPQPAAARTTQETTEAHSNARIEAMARA